MKPMKCLVYKPAFANSELRSEFPNFAAIFGILSEELSEIDCKKQDGVVICEKLNSIF